MNCNCTSNVQKRSFYQFLEKLETIFPVNDYTKNTNIGGPRFLHGPQGQQPQRGLLLRLLRQQEAQQDQDGRDPEVPRHH